jgi:pimeloyl-ACP methyl ester carboxylesterase
VPFANNQGVKIHYEVMGQGPPLVMVHGFTRSLEDWRNFGFVPELKNDYQLILIDVRGHGQSDKPDNLNAYNLKTMAEDVATIMDELNIERAHYWGYSMGGRIGFYGMTRYYLPRLNSLILGGFTACPDEKNPQEYQGILNLTQSAVEKGMQVIVSAFEKEFGIKLEQSYYMSLNPRALLGVQKNLMEAYSEGIDDEIISKIIIPCLFYVGELDDSARITGIKKTVYKISGARFISFPQLDHWTTIVRSDLVVPHIKKFLAEVEKN